MTDQPPQPVVRPLERNGDNVGSRVDEAKKTAALAEASLAAVSAKKLALLKQMPIGRLARLGPDADLTKADAADLRHWIADRTGRRQSKTRTIKTRLGLVRGSRRRRPSFGIWTTGIGVVVLGTALVLAVLRTPERFFKLPSSTSYYVRLSDGSTRSITLPGATVVIQDQAASRPGMIEGRYWVASQGYRTELFVLIK